MEVFCPGRMDVMSKSPKQYPPELKERACRLVEDWRRARQRTNGGFIEIGEQLDVHPETLWNWFKQWRVENGARVDDC